MLLLMHSYQTLVSPCNTHTNTQILQKMMSELEFYLLDCVIVIVFIQEDYGIQLCIFKLYTQVNTQVVQDMKLLEL